jgi:pimeloyl-ACP methyl ester carboxylesterase
MSMSGVDMREPFEIAVSDDVLDDLQNRLTNTRLPPDGGIAGWSEGVEPAYLADLITSWRTGYDWRAQELGLNQFHHFRATVDGTRLHFIHERGVGPSPIPLVLTHGYPDCFYRFHKLILLLTDPATHGGDAADAFDVVVPSLPGYAFSEPRTQSGGTFGFGSLWHALMTDELGYRRYGAHGGDWGSTVTEHLARSHSSAVIGIHLTDIPFWHTFQKPKDLSRAESKFLDRIQHFQTKDGAYAMIQGTRPRTPAFALNDSPAGLAAWIIEKFEEWSDCDGDIESCISKDELLTNVMIYWVTQTIGSSFQPYRDFMKAGAARWIMEAAKGWVGSTTTPAGIAIFPKDLAPSPREWANRFYNVQRWTEMPRGGHFAALEEPECLAEDIRAFFRPLRDQG